MKNSISFFLFLFAFGAFQTSAIKPNIVFFLVDDLGWADVGCYGSQRLDIDYFDPLQTLVLSDSISPEMRNLLPFMLSEPVGLASSIFASPSNNQSSLTKTINLLPESKLTNLNFKRKQPLLLLSAFLPVSYTHLTLPTIYSV